MCAALFGLIAVCSTIALAAAGAGGAGGRQPFEQKTAPFEEEIEIAVRRGRHASDAFERAERAGDFLRNRPRRLPQPPCQLERDRCAKIAEFAVRRVLEDDRGRLRGVERVQLDEQSRDVRTHAVVDGKNHRASGFRLRLEGSCGTLFTSCRFEMSFPAACPF